MLLTVIGVWKTSAIQKSAAVFTFVGLLGQPGPNAFAVDTVLFCSESYPQTKPNLGHYVSHLFRIRNVLDNKSQ